jgi:3-deoxy-7-phosphoheptulonate synthase
MPPDGAPADRAYHRVSRDHQSEDTVVRVGDVAIGDGSPILIAGPCSVESRDQILRSAEAVAAAGGHLLRGGCFKPRTSPYSFQGRGAEGLALLAEAGRRFGLPVITEVLAPGDVAAVAARADVLQIGARNMQNFPLLKAAGTADQPVMLKRGMMASIDEWLAAAEYIVAHGNPDVFLCERGIQTFTSATRYTLDLSSVPVAQERTHLPVVVDPSHACGTRRWVPPLVRAAVAADADGVMVEAHPCPEDALSDGPQSLPLSALGRLGTLFGSGSD